MIIEIWPFGDYKVLVQEESDLYEIIESKHVTFDESLFPGTPGLEEAKLDEISDIKTWESNYSSHSEDLVTEFSNELSASEVLSGEEQENGTGVHDDESIYGNENQEYAVNNGEENGSTNDSDRSESPELVLGKSHLPRYPRRARRPPPGWFMAAKIETISITTGDHPTLKEALNATPDEREAWLTAIHEELNVEYLILSLRY